MRSVIVSIFIIFNNALPAPAQPESALLAEQARQAGRQLAARAPDSALLHFNREYCLRLPKPDSALARCAYNIASCWRGLERYDSAVFWAKRSLELHQKYYGSLHSETQDARLLAAQQYYYNRQYQAAMQLLEQLCADSPEAETPQTAPIQAHILYAGIYMELGDYERAQAHLEYCLRHEAALPDDLRARVRHNKAVWYSRRGDDATALAHYEQAKVWRLKVWGAEHINTLLITENQALCYLRLGQTEQALLFLKQVLNACPKTARQMRGRILAHQAAAYERLGQKETAIKLLREALIQYADQYPGYQLQTLLLLAAAYQRQNCNEQALKSYQRAQQLAEQLHPEQVEINDLYLNWGDFWLQDNRPDSALSCFERVRTAGERPLQALRAGYGTALCKKEHSEAFLQFSTNGLRSALELLPLVSLGQDYETYLDLLEKWAELSLEVCYKLQLPHKALWLMECHKALLLKQLQPISPEQRLLHLELHECRRRLQEEAGRGGEPGLLSELSREIGRLHAGLSPLLPGIEPQTLPALPGDSLYVLQYHWGKQALYCLHGSANRSLKLERMPLPDSDLLVRFINACADDRSDCRQFAQDAYALYRQLLPPGLPDSGRLLLVPHRDLERLNWELLLDAPVGADSDCRFYHLPYLLHRFAFQYSPSLRHWQGVQERPAPKRNRFWALGADYQSGSGLAPLPAARAELQQLQTLWEGDFDYTARLERFRLQASGYSMLHLALHADADSVAGSLLHFSDGALPASGLGGLNLNGTEWLALNACWSGTGAYRVGEGMVGLARQGLYAGAGAVLAHLWAVSDQGTARLNSLLYNQLKQNLPKDIALRRAKIELLSGAGNRAAHPSHWASAVLWGHGRPLAQPENPFLLLPISAGIGIAGLVLGGWLQKRRAALPKRESGSK